MKIEILNARALNSFTSVLTNALVNIEVPDLESRVLLCQLHGAPHSIEEDLQLIEKSVQSQLKTFYLIHRPDEILFHAELVNRIKNLIDPKFVFLGDLVLSIPFWKDYANQITVIPHPFTDLRLPNHDGPIIVGSYTSWGEMRDINHFISLARELRNFGNYKFIVGGSGVDKEILPSFVDCSTDFFIPHINTQLYHLNGKKRIGESSGSLHRGITVPVIFEANGAERLEGLVVVKIESDTNLSNINYSKAALEISKLDLKNSLNHNLNAANNNTPEVFAKRLLDLFARSI